MDANPRIGCRGPLQHTLADRLEEMTEREPISICARVSCVPALLYVCAYVRGSAGLPGPLIDNSGMNADVDERTAELGTLRKRRFVVDASDPALTVKIDFDPSCISTAPVVPLRTSDVLWCSKYWRSIWTYIRI